MEESPTDKSIAGIKAGINSAIKRNIIYHTRDVSRTDWRLFLL